MLPVVNSNKSGLYRDFESPTMKEVPEGRMGGRWEPIEYVGGSVFAGDWTGR